MHSCRTKYSLLTYRNILEQRNSSFLLHLRDTTTQKEYIYKPRTKSLFHSKFAGNYLKPRQDKLLTLMKKKEMFMLTLTYWTKLYSPEEVVARHKKDIKKFFRMMKKLGYIFKYCYFIELTKKFYIHFHIFIDRFVMIEDIKKVWKKITGSYIVYVTRIRTKAQMVYCSRYNSIISKFSFAQMQFIWNLISRLFGASRNIWAGIETEKKKWMLVEKLFTRGLSVWKLLHLHIEEAEFFLSFDDFAENLQSSNVRWIEEKDNRIVILHF